MIEAYGDRVVVKLVVAEKKAGMLILPDEEKNYRIGEVVSVADQLTGLLWQKVIYNRYDGVMVDYKGETYYILDMKNILAIVKEN
jgi:co-chaperonin GroES (HSP10)